MPCGPSATSSTPQPAMCSSLAGCGAGASAGCSRRARISSSWSHHRVRGPDAMYDRGAMSRAATSPLQPSHEQRRAALSRHLLGRVEPLLEGGESYADLSVERIIRAGDIARSTFYVYFADKGELLGAMTEHITTDLAEAATGWFQLPPDGSKDDLRASLRVLFAAYRQHRHVLGAISEAAAYEPTARERHRLLVRAAVSGLADHIERAQAAGAAAPELDAERTAKWLTWMLERGLYALVANAGAGEVERLLDAMTDIAWRTLYA